MMHGVPSFWSFPRSIFSSRTFCSLAIRSSVAYLCVLVCCVDHILNFLPFFEFLSHARHAEITFLFVDDVKIYNDSDNEDVVNIDLQSTAKWEVDRTIEFKTPKWKKGQLRERSTSCLINACRWGATSSTMIKQNVKSREHRWRDLS